MPVKPHNAKALHVPGGTLYIGSVPKTPVMQRFVGFLRRNFMNFITHPPTIAQPQAKTPLGKEVELMVTSVRQDRKYQKEADEQADFAARQLLKLLEDAADTMIELGLPVQKDTNPKLPSRIYRDELPPKYALYYLYAGTVMELAYDTESDEPYAVTLFRRKPFWRLRVAFRQKGFMQIYLHNYGKAEVLLKDAVQIIINATE